jgi:hypothetical protein
MAFTLTAPANYTARMKYFKKTRFKTDSSNVKKGMVSASDRQWTVSGKSQCPLCSLIEKKYFADGDDYVWINKRR